MSAWISAVADAADYGQRVTHQQQHDVVHQVVLLDEQWAGVSAEARDFVLQLLQLQPERRPKVEQLVEKKQTWWRRHAKSIKRRLKIKLKVLWSFYQIATKVGETYLVAFPKSVEKSLEVLSFVNLELDGLGLPLACVELSGFRNKLLLMMLAPIGVLLFTKLIGWCRRDRSHERAVIEQARALGARSSSRASRASARLRSSRVAFKQSTYAFLPMALRVSFIAFPTVSSLAFKAFRCDDLDANDHLRGPAVMVRWPSWRGHSWRPRALQSASEGSGLPSTLGRSVSSPHIPPTGHGS